MVCNTARTPSYKNVHIEYMYIWLLLLLLFFQQYAYTCTCLSAIVVAVCLLSFIVCALLLVRRQSCWPFGHLLLHATLTFVVTVGVVYCLFAVYLYLHASAAIYLVYNIAAATVTVIVASERFSCCCSVVLFISLLFVCGFLYTCNVCPYLITNASNN